MTAETLDFDRLRTWPLPEIADDADKEERGRVVVVAGSREIAGAAQLAGIAALRAGAGKLVIATAASVSAQVGQAVPEARVIGLPEHDKGSFREAGMNLLDTSLDGAAAVLIGPGMMDPQGNLPLVEAILRRCRGVPVVIDACAMDVVRKLGSFDQPVLLTPHAGEMSHLTRARKEEIARDPLAAATRASRAWNATVALKGALTFIASPDGRAMRYEDGDAGLGTSGSGDVLAGLIAGFAARGAPLGQACAWGVVMHGMAGRALARSIGPVGYLARELAGAVPALMERAGRGVRPRAR